MTRQFNLFFVDRFKGRVLFDLSMKDYTSIKIGGPADVMAFPKDSADLRELIKFAVSKKFPVFFLGSGSNLLVRDGGIRGIVINMSEGLSEINFNGETKLCADAGVSLARLLKVCVDKGLSGLEFTAGIPGSIGGAVYMNAGCFGSTISSVVDSAEIVDKKGKKAFIKAVDMGFSYRASALPKGSAIVRVNITLKSKDREEIEARVKELRAKRKQGAPVVLPNAGSVFKNPKGEVAGRLIEECGLKGERVGKAEISTAHANYIVNRGGATAKDVLSLMALIRDRVYSSKGVMLEPEIKVVGED